MACEDQISTTDLENAKLDALALGEVATSRAGAVVGGAAITQATNRFGEVTDTVQGRLDKMGVIIDDPIRDWSASLLVSDLRAHRYPATTGDVYIPTKALPFTTGATFNTNDWAIYQGLNTTDLDTLLINDLSQTYTFKTVGLMKASTIVFPIGKKIFWQGYHVESDGGSNFGLVTSGSHTDDGGSMFTLADGKYIEANLKGSKVNIKKFGGVNDGVNDDTVSIVSAAKFCHANGLVLRMVGNSIFKSSSVSGGDIITVSGQPYILGCSIEGMGDAIFNVDGNIGFSTDGVQRFIAANMTIYTTNRYLTEADSEGDGASFFRNQATRLSTIYKDLNVSNDVADSTGPQRAPVFSVEFGTSNILKVDNIRLKNSVGFLQCIGTENVNINAIHSYNISTLMYLRSATDAHVTNCSLINTASQQLAWVGRLSASPRASNGLDLIQTELCGTVTVSGLSAIHPCEYTTYIQAERTQISSSSCKNASGFKAVGTSYANPAESVAINDCHVELDSNNTKSGLFVVECYAADNVVVNGCSGRNYVDTNNNLAYFYVTTNIYGWTNKRINISNNDFVNGNWFAYANMQSFTAAELTAIDPAATFLICDDITIQGNYHKKANNSLFGMLYNTRDNDGSIDAKATYATKNLRIYNNTCELKDGGITDKWFFDARYVDGAETRGNDCNLPFSSVFSDGLVTEIYQNIKMDEKLLKLNSSLSTTFTQLGYLAITGGSELTFTDMKLSTVTSLNVKMGVDGLGSTGSKQMNITGRGYWVSGTGLEGGIQMTASGDFYVGKAIAGVKTDQVSTPPIATNVSAGNFEIRGDIVPTVNYFVDIKLL